VTNLFTTLSNFISW